jgi:hypothetical protein
MVLDEEEKRREAPAANSKDLLNGEKETQEGDEGRIELLQWYLKMILDSDEEMNPIRGPAIQRQL